ncbi:hypothetical protein N657DRAFT_681376 [Parathielavia appendiculata]|uniref:RRM domain-containing protein n=1 Tax=Parathielavia appendiculata TaxID=2587402 RepID=A0AAN6U0W2_9PEZI|nr:hypothetical protein N657DRAFT_681376 [Parathielavia appendiculata]
MAQVRDATFNPSSPHSSSGGADSCKHDGTPETKLTVFSPEDSSARSNKLATARSLNGPPDHPVQHNINPPETFGILSAAAEKDPFVSITTVPRGEQRLSPTASAFRPVSVPVVAHGSLNVPPGMNAAGLGVNRQLFTPQATAKFSHELGISRCLVVYSASQPVSIADVGDYLAKLERLGSPCQGKRNAVSTEGKIWLHLSNVRDARNIHDNIQLGSPEWCAEYIAPDQFYRVCPSPAQADPICDGKVQITAISQGIGFGGTHVEAVVQTFLETQGEVFAFLRMSDFNDHTFQALAEFADGDIAIAVVHRFNGVTLNGVHLLLTMCHLFHPDGTAATYRSRESPSHSFNASRSSVLNGNNIIQGMGLSDTPQQANASISASRLVQSPAGLHAPQQYAMYPAVCHGLPPAGPNRFVVDQTPTRGQGVAPMPPMSPMSGSMPIMAPLYNTTPPATPMAMHGGFTSPRGIQPYGRLDSRRQNAMRVHRSPYYNNAGHHNHVDVNRIRDGIDVRTTIMLRNIPNKVDQAMLKRIIDESSWGKYDFMYLRIDFANDCNVGYAFINFVDPLDIIDFVNARGNQRWNCFKSDKVAEISYATIQGKDCLVQKFRNSSVMLEAPHYRPKLYYTLNGPRPDLAGQEEPFPEPDNQSKMKRSCENAEHVGLFTPNAGQHFRDEQRRRRSQYDRGTRLAALEEYDYGASHGLFSPQGM